MPSCKNVAGISCCPSIRLNLKLHFEDAHKYVWYLLFIELHLSPPRV